MWLLVSGGLKPLASYSPTRTFTRLERNIYKLGKHTKNWSGNNDNDDDNRWRRESETHSLGPIFLRLWAAVKIWKQTLKIFYHCLTNILKIIISVCIKACLPCEYHDQGRCWRFGEQEHKCQGSRCSERGLSLRHSGAKWSSSFLVRGVKCWRSFEKGTTWLRIKQVHGNSPGLDSPSESPRTYFNVFVNFVCTLRKHLNID